MEEQVIVTIHSCITAALLALVMTGWADHKRKMNSITTRVLAAITCLSTAWMIGFALYLINLSTQ